jgi:molybdopterin-guanine dinucleotide biosynthesis protein A
MNNFIKNCTGVILAGGENTRMPVPKAFIKVSGKPVIENNLKIIKELFMEVFIVTNQPENYAHLRTPMLGDIYDIRGPMTGIFTSLVNSSNPWVFISACDMPFLNKDLIEYMASKRGSHDAVIPNSPCPPESPLSKSARLDSEGENRKVEPLFAFYSKRLIASMEKTVLSGKRGVKDFLKGKKVKYITTGEIKGFDPEAMSFINLNTPGDVKHHLGVQLKNLKHKGGRHVRSRSN